MNNVKFVAGKEVEVISVSGGWTTILDHNGKTKKVRNSDVKSTAAAAKEQVMPATKVAARVAASALQVRKTAKTAASALQVRKTAKTAARVAANPADGEGTIPPAVVITPDMARYTTGLAKTVSGRATVDIADEIAGKFRGLEIDAVYALAAKILGEDVADLIGDYKHLNLGMQRMNLGNRCRAALANREKAKAAA